MDTLLCGRGVLSQRTLLYVALPLPLYARVAGYSTAAVPGTSPVGAVPSPCVRRLVARMGCVFTVVIECPYRIGPFLQSSSEVEARQASPERPKLIEIQL